MHKILLYLPQFRKFRFKNPFKIFITGQFFKNLKKLALINEKSLTANATRLEMSGWQDSNLRPPAPKAGAITGLRYTPNELGMQKKQIFVFLQNYLR